MINETESKFGTYTCRKALLSLPFFSIISFSIYYETMFLIMAHIWSISNRFKWEYHQIKSFSWSSFLRLEWPSIVILKKTVRTAVNFQSKIQPFLFMTLILKPGDKHYKRRRLNMSNLDRRRQFIYIHNPLPHRRFS